MYQMKIKMGVLGKVFLTVFCNCSRTSPVIRKECHVKNVRS